MPLAKIGGESVFSSVDKAGGNHEITDILVAVPWGVTWEADFNETAHVNLQDALAAERRLVLSIGEGLTILRIATFSDSWVAISA